MKSPIIGTTGPADAKGVFRKIDGCEMRWADKTALWHIVEGAEVHEGIRLLWTLCERDVPAGEAFLKPKTGSAEMCIICMKRYTRQQRGESDE